jgi:hypothetical protein
MVQRKGNKMKKISGFVLILFIFYLVIFSSSCSKKETGWKGKIEIENGITLIKNPKEPIYKKSIFSITENLVITGSEDREEWMFQDIGTLDVDREGNIYVLDVNAGNIKAFDPKGDYLKIIGKKGEGPGEFGFPINVVISPQKEILVYDMGRRSLVILSWEGRYLRRLTASMFLFSGPGITSDGSMVASYTIPGDTLMTELKKFDGELKPLLTFASLPMGTPPVLDVFIARSLSNLRWGVTVTDDVVWGNILNTDYVLNICDLQGNLKRKIIKEYDPISISSSEEEILMKEWFKDAPARDQWDLVFPKNYPPFESFTLDDEGRIYVKTYEKPSEGKGFYYEVFDPEGRFITKILIDLTSSAMRFTLGNLYTIEEDLEGFKSVKRYKVKWDL